MSVRYALLALLSDEPKFGLQLKQDFEAHTGEVWPLNVGQVYTTLKRLVRDDMVVADDDEGDASQTVYQLTDKGRGELNHWLSQSGSANPPRDELVIKILIALTLSDVDISKIIQSHRRSLIEQMQVYTKLKKNDDDLGLTLAADAEIFRIEAAVRWLDAAEVRISQGQRINKPEPTPATKTIKSQSNVEEVAK